jgi:hypothetical protein
MSFLSRISPCYCTYPCMPPAFPLFSYTALLYSLTPFIPDCSVANRRIERAASDWLANSVRAVPAHAVQLFQFGFSHTSAHARPGKLGSDWRTQFDVPRSDWSYSWCSDRGLLLGRLGIGVQLEIGERGYVLQYSCTHTYVSILCDTPCPPKNSTLQTASSSGPQYSEGYGSP